LRNFNPQLNIFSAYLSFLYKQLDEYETDVSQEGRLEQLIELIVQLVDNFKAFRVLLVGVQINGVVVEQDGVGRVLECLDLVQVELDCRAQAAELAAQLVQIAEALQTRLT
jgi:hypothetical protein